MTKVIKEGNSYEFPSQDIHRTIINKLIMNDSTLFRHLFNHIKQEYTKNEKTIKKKIQQASLQSKQPGATADSISKSSIHLANFIEVFEQFTKEVEQDINKGVQLLNIDYYMRDLKKHAIEEYSEVTKIEEKLISDTLAKSPGQAVEDNQMLNIRYGLLQTKDSNSLQSNDALFTEQINMLANPNALTNDLFDLSMLDAKEKKKLKKKQRKRDKKIKQQMA